LIILTAGNLLFSFLKFALVGISGMGIDFGITYLLKEKIKINKFIASAIGFCAAVSSNYYFNRIWTFESTNPDIAFEYSSFFIISLIGLGINTAALWFLTSKLKIKFYFAKFLAILITAIWNFSSNTLFTFSKQV
jgi:putative flippase GtrA